tara:strand:+ start:26005 stop:26118 length:114 start_codon:yes stop_codon:yes gene_type:complete
MKTSGILSWFRYDEQDYFKWAFFGKPAQTRFAESHIG